MKAAAYVRVSTDEQTKSGFSLPEQRHALTEYIARQGWQLVEVVADEGKSGADPRRAGLMRLLELAQTGEIEVAASLWRDRFFRDIYDRRGFEADMRELGARLVSLNDTGSYFADTVVDAVGEQQRRDISEKVRNGRKGKARSGKLPGGSKISWGYKLTDDKSTLEVDPETMPYVHRVFEAIGAHGRSMTSVANEFTGEGIHTPGGSRRWVCTVVRRIVDNEIYVSRTREEVAALVSPTVAATLDKDSYSIYFYGQYEATRVGTRGAKLGITPQDPDNWIAIPVQDAGIPVEFVRAARSRVASNQRYPQSIDPRITLRGFIRCECGRSMTNYQSRGNRYYACPDQRSKRCTAGNAVFHRLDYVEGKVQEFVLGMLRDPDTFRERVERQAETERRELMAGDREVRALYRELDELDRREDNLVEAIAERSLGSALADKLTEKIEQIGTDRQKLQERLEQVSDTEQRIRRLNELPAQVEDFLADLPHLVDGYSRSRMVDGEPLIRDYETVPPERTPENPLALYRPTPEHFRDKTEEEIKAERRKALAERAARFRHIYSALGLVAVVRADRGIEIQWEGALSGGTQGQPWVL